MSADRGKVKAALNLADSIENTDAVSSALITLAGEVRGLFTAVTTAARACEEYKHLLTELHGMVTRAVQRDEHFAMVFASEVQLTARDDFDGGNGPLWESMCDTIDRLTERLDSEHRIAEAGKAFHDLAVAQRNQAWHEVEELKAALAGKRAELMVVEASRTELMIDLHHTRENLAWERAQKAIAMQELVQAVERLRSHLTALEALNAVLHCDTPVRDSDGPQDAPEAPEATQPPLRLVSFVEGIEFARMVLPPDDECPTCASNERDVRRWDCEDVPDLWHQEGR